jgi:hypothetical protein
MGGNHGRPRSARVHRRRREDSRSYRGEWTAFIAGIGLWLAGIGKEITAMQSLSELWSQAFIGEHLVQIGGFIVGLAGAYKLRGR